MAINIDSLRREADCGFAPTTGDRAFRAAAGAGDKVSRRSRESTFVNSNWRWPAILDSAPNKIGAWLRACRSLRAARGKNFCASLKPKAGPKSRRQRNRNPIIDSTSSPHKDTMRRLDRADVHGSWRRLKAAPTTAGRAKAGAPLLPPAPLFCVPGPRADGRRGAARRQIDLHANRLRLRNDEIVTNFSAPRRGTRAIGCGRGDL